MNQQRPTARSFNPPPAFRQGGTGVFQERNRFRPVSIRPPPFGKGELGASHSQSASNRFQSAPRLSARGNSRNPSCKPAQASFNPPPAFRQGGTFRSMEHRLEGNVSIRPPPFGKGERNSWSRGSHDALCFNPPPAFRQGGTSFPELFVRTPLRVSIRPPPFGKGEHQQFDQATEASWFQSAPRLSARGNLRFDRFRLRLMRFNPPPAFRQGGTWKSCCTGSDWNVSIRPPPFGKGERPIPLTPGMPSEFQSAPRLSARGNWTAKVSGPGG